MESKDGAGAQTGAGHTPTLLPCPFCGSSKIYCTGDAGEEALMYEVGCITAGCEGQFDSGLFMTADEALDAWNRRAPVNSQAEMLAALKDVQHLLSAQHQDADVVTRTVATNKAWWIIENTLQAHDTAIANAERAEREGK